MSTTDSREAFLEWKRDEGDIPNYIPDATIMASGYSDFELKAWQAALAWQAAKATGTAGEQETHNFEICMYFDNWLISKGFASTSRTEDVDGPMAPAMNWIDAVEAAIEAARQPEAVKATGTAGELFGYGSSEKKNCLLSKAQYDSCAPKNRIAYDIPLYAHSLPKCEGCKGYGVITHVSGQTPDNYQECNEECPECQGTGEAARHDKDGNHADDLRGMLDELQTEFDKQQSAFWACSEKLAQVQRNQETELSDIRILELAEEDFGEQDDRNVKNEALLSFARMVQVARQPAPVVAGPLTTENIACMGFDTFRILQGMEPHTYTAQQIAETILARRK